MLIMIVAVMLGTLLLTRAPRLAAVAEVDSRKKVRAYVDGKPVDSYVKEDPDCV